MRHTVARVAFDSPLPQLTRLFDYAIPEELANDISLGCVVSVNFNRSAKPISAYVVETLEVSDFAGELSAIVSVVSKRQLLAPKVFELASAVAKRQAVAVGDVLRVAVPARAVRVDKNWLAPSMPTSTREPETLGRIEPQLQALQVRPAVIKRGSSEAPAWFFEILDRVSPHIASGGSVLVCVPDFRDIDRVAAFLAAHNAQLLLNVYSTTATPSERYARHLLASSGLAQVLIGARSSLYAPLKNLAEIILWDDEDQSHVDQASPYISSRELALLRQRVEACHLTLMSNARSVAAERLIELGYLAAGPEPMRPLVAFSETEARLDSLAYNTIRDGLKVGPVLVQVAGLGQATGLYCASCSKRATCQFCASGLRLDSQRRVVCRVCEGFNLSESCRHCGATDRHLGRAGASRTAEELGKTFAGVRVFESVAANAIASVSDKPKIVVATAGVEPLAEKGYAAVVILDVRIALGRDTLNAEEDAIRSWVNAIALGSTDSHSALIGIPADLGAKISTWQLSTLAKQELVQRREFGFPPVARVASATGAKSLLLALQDELSSLEQVRVLGLSKLADRDSTTGEHQLVFTFAYGASAEVVPLLAAFSLKSSGQLRTTSSGRNRRPLTIKLDDSRVL